VLFDRNIWYNKYTMNNITQTISGNFSSWSNQVFSALKVENPYFLALDIILTAILLYWFLSKIVESRAIRVLYGLVVIFIIFAIAQILNLKVLDWMLRYLSLAILIAIPIIFHPEIRAVLERLGGSGFKRIWGTSKKTKINWAKEITRAISQISAQKYGGLIVVENSVPLNEYIEKGVKLNGEISTSLIESIFAPNSDLNDGAIIISKGQIVAVKVVLPVSNISSGLSFGSRHLAGIGVSEDTDALAIIVSSNGRISVAFHGKIREANSAQVRNILKELWKVK